MSQQINLLRPKSNPAAAALWAGAAVVVAALAMVGYGQFVTAQTQDLRQRAAAGEARLAQVRTAVQMAQAARQGQASPAELAAELADLRARASLVQQLVQEVRGGTLGSPEGYSRHFDLLAGAARDDVWVTSISVARGGGEVLLTGRALTSDAVMQYVRRLNEAFKPLGVRFNSVELTPEGVSSPAPSAVAFKLS